MKSHETLGTNVIPKSYKLLLSPDMHSFTFSGDEQINVNIAKPTNEIALNSNGLKIEFAAIVKGKQSEIAKVVYKEKEEKIILKFDGKFDGNALLKINYTGKIGDTLNGLYRSAYYVNGKKEFLLTTQFEAPDARRAFPCFDEPAFKAEFELALLVDKELDCVSNMPIKQVQDKGNGKKLVVFEKTPKMSTYLVYIGIGKFEYVETKLGTLKIRVLTTKGKKDYANLPAQYARTFVKFYEDYFGIKYPLPKLDLIAIPDFAAGAMENWGAITFRETSLLADEHTALEVKQNVAITVAHELAHQWFGDLVTMKWWNDLWLNESFATFMSYKAVDNAFPEWEMQKQYLLEISTALSEDALRTTHPISTNVSSPGEISSIFDAISYEKGGSVLNMLEDYVTPEIFRKGLHNYLKKHAYGNAEAKDLWQAIDEVSKIKISNIARNWLFNEGYPIVSVKAEPKSRQMLLSQSRFLINGTSAGKWIIPIHYLTSAREEGKTLLYSKEKSVKIAEPEWVKINYGQKGVYRASYEQNMLERLAEAVKKKELGDVDAWGIENDLFALVRASRISVRAYLKIVDNYFVGSGYPANTNTLGHLHWLWLQFYSLNIRKEIEKTIEDIASSILAKVGIKPRKGESSINKIERSSALFGLGICGDEKVIRLAHKVFEDKLNGKRVDTDISRVCYSIEASNGNAKTFSQFKDLYEKEQVPYEKVRLLSTLGDFKEEKLIRNALAFTLSNNVRNQDKMRIPAELSINPFAAEALLDWTINNWHTLMETYPEGTMMLHRFIQNLEGINDQVLADKFSNFFKRNENRRKDVLSEINKAKERIAANIKLLNANKE